jgi:hypothetical protein
MVRIDVRAGCAGARVRGRVKRLVQGVSSIDQTMRYNLRELLGEEITRWWRSRGLGVETPGGADQCFAMGGAGASS